MTPHTSVQLRLSAIDHPELILLARLIRANVTITEDLVERHANCTVNGQTCSPLAAALAMARSCNPSVLDVSVIQWIEFAYHVVAPALRTSPDPLGVALGPINASLEGRSFLQRLGATEPSPADWLLWAMLGTRIAALTPTLARERYWRVVRWGEYLRVLAGEAGASVKAFDFTQLSTVLGEVDGAKKNVKEASEQQVADQKQTDPAARVDIRVGCIKSLIKHPNADRLYIETVDLGDPEGRLRTVVSGLVEHFPAGELEGRLCVFLCNLKPAAICKTTSEAMILVGKSKDSAGVETVRLLKPPQGSKAGDRVWMEGIVCHPDKQLRPKDGIWTAFLERVQVVNGRVVYRTDSLESSPSSPSLITNAGPVSVDLDSGIIS